MFLTILDTHVASLAAAFLFQFGSGAIRGFATMLTLGLLTNAFTAVVVSRMMFELTLARGRRVTLGSSIGSDSRRRGAYAMAGALSGITAYLAVRFRPSVAAGAAVPTAHDLIVTVAALILAGYDLDLNVVAALLTVAGYSVNDTIVIFDRVRERLWSVERGAIGAAVNAAVTDTLGRTIITSGTTLAAVLALYFFGGTALEGFAFALLVGIVAGTWSTVFVAAPVAALLARRSPRGGRSERQEGC